MYASFLNVTVVPYLAFTNGSCEDLFRTESIISIADEIPSSFGFICRVFSL